jgi:hypothetical protein
MAKGKKLLIGFAIAVAGMLPVLGIARASGLSAKDAGALPAMDAGALSAYDAGALSAWDAAKAPAYEGGAAAVQYDGGMPPMSAMDAGKSAMDAGSLSQH